MSFFTLLTYFYPVVKESKRKLHCENNAIDYIVKNKNFVNITRNQLRMLSTNFCNGGEEIYKIDNVNG